MQIKEWLIKNKDILLAIAIVNIAFVVLYHMIPFLYETNDDRYMQDIVSGSITGEPDAHMIYMGYLIGLFLSSLYRITAFVPWYGLFLVSIHVVCMILIVGKLFSKTKGNIGKCIVAILFLLVFVMIEVPQVTRIQYTSTAALAGATAIFWFLSEDEGLSGKRFIKYHSVTVLLAMCSYAMRQQAFLMLLPIAGSLFLYQMLIGRKTLRKKQIGLVFAILTSLAICFLADCIGYRQAEWKEFKRFDRARQQIYDYTGFPPYEEYETWYRGLGIEYEEYIGLSEHYFLLMSDLDADKMEEIARVSKEYAKRDSSISGRLYKAAREMAWRVVKDGDYPINRVILLFYAIVLMLIILQKKWIAIGYVACLLFGRGICWVYLLYQGRMPERVSIPLYIAEILVLLAVFLTHSLSIWFTDVEGIRKKIRVMIGLALLFYGVISFSNYAHQRYLFSYYQTKSLYEREMAVDILNDYCSKRLDSIFFVDNYSTSWHNEKVLGNLNPPFHNYIVMGGWMLNSPLVQNKLERMGIDNLKETFSTHKNLYVIFEEGWKASSDYFWDFMNSKYNYDLELVDQVQASEETWFLVYRIRVESEY